MMNDLGLFGDYSVMVHIILASFFILKNNNSPSHALGFQAEPACLLGKSQGLPDRAGLAV